MVCAPPLDSTPGANVSFPVTSAAVSVLIWAAVNDPPLHTRVGLPTHGAVNGQPTSRSLTGSVPVIGSRFWAEASANSGTDAGWVITDSTGASLVPVMVMVTVWAAVPPLLSATWTV